MLQVKYYLAKYLTRQYRSVQGALLPRWSRRRGLYFLGAKSLSVLKKDGARNFVRRAMDKVRRILFWGEHILVGIEGQAELNRQYVRWLEKNALKQEDFVRMKGEASQLAYKPVISIATPIFNVAEVWLRGCIESVLNQIYPYWELCLVDDGSTDEHVSVVVKEYAARDNRIKVAFLKKNAGIAKATNKALEMITGEFVAFLDHDDELAPEALFKIAERLNEAPQLDLLYSDEDKIEVDGTHVEPFFKPGWSPDLLLSTNYICHLSVVRKTLVDEIGRIRSGFEGSQDFDLLLRVTERTNSIAHIPAILYHWRKIETSAANTQMAKPSAYKAGHRALEQALGRRGLTGHVEILSPGRYRVRYSIEGDPLISIIIPVKRTERLQSCISSINRKSTYQNYELLLVCDANSEQRELRELLQMSGVSNVLFYQQGYSWAGMSNFGAGKSRGLYLIFVSPDVQVVEPNWLQAMLEHAQREFVGVVGSKLVSSANIIQHAGVFIGFGGLYGNAFRGLPDYSGGYLQFSNLIRNCSAVTGRCMMLRREIHEIVGEFDEEFRESHSDVDFCLRARGKGYRIVYTPVSVLSCDESSPREFSDGDPDDIRARQKWGSLLKTGDPYYNANLSLMHEDFRLQI